MDLAGPLFTDGQSCPLLVSASLLDRTTPGNFLAVASRKGLSNQPDDLLSQANYIETAGADNRL
jgi:hypothetical protein